MNENTKLQPCFDQGSLVDGLIAHLGLKNDAALARALNVAPPVISKLRHHKLPLSASILLRMHEESGLSIKELRWMMGDQRPMFRPISKETIQRQPKPLTSYLRRPH